jgi:anti-anti-sigma regulatory factor
MTPFSLQTNGSSVRLRLCGEVTIQNARELATALQSSLQPSQTLLVDAGELTRFDAAILQVLLACAQVAADTVLEKSSPAWSACFQRYASSDPFRSA